jgi:peptidyl-tRNA hydrolase
MKKIVKQLTPRDAVLGIGRKASEEELAEYLNRPRKEEFKSIQQIRDEITAAKAVVSYKKDRQQDCYGQQGNY